MPSMTFGIAGQKFHDKWIADPVAMTWWPTAGPTIIAVFGYWMTFLYSTPHDSRYS